MGNQVLPQAIGEMRLGAAALVLCMLIASPAGAATDQCRACHLGLGEPRLATPAREFAADIHSEKGFGCAECHGGDPARADMEAMSPKHGFVGRPPHRQIPQLCGRCHSDPVFMKRYSTTLRVDQVAQYRTSIHGQRLEQRDDQKVAVCVSCHSAHRISPASNPESTVNPQRVPGTCARCHSDAEYMKEYGIRTDQWARYQRSVHWQVLSLRGDPSAPSCNSCHGNHGAAPPGVATVAAVCGQCHAAMATLFAASPHAAAFAEAGKPGCVVCHGNHEIRPANDEMLGVAAPGVCGSCHSSEDGGGQAAAAMRDRLVALRTDTERARAILSQAERAGMEVSQAQFDLRGADEAMVKSRAAVHAASADAVQREVAVGAAIAAKGYAAGVRALRELRFRREGLAISAVIIGVLIAGLVLKIRELDRRRTADAVEEERRR